MCITAAGFIGIAAAESDRSACDILNDPIALNGGRFSLYNFNVHLSYKEINIFVSIFILFNLMYMYLHTYLSVDNVRTNLDEYILWYMYTRRLRTRTTETKDVN